VDFPVEYWPLAVSFQVISSSIHSCKCTLLMWVYSWTIGAPKRLWHHLLTFDSKPSHKGLASSNSSSCTTQIVVGQYLYLLAIKPTNMPKRRLFPISQINISGGIK
jgi:hypothetical protein